MFVGYHWAECEIFFFLFKLKNVESSEIYIVYRYLTKKYRDMFFSATSPSPSWFIYITVPEQYNSNVCCINVCYVK